MAKVMIFKEMKNFPEIKKNIISIGLILKYGAEMEGDEKGMNINHKGTNMNFKCSSKGRFYYLHALIVKKKIDINLFYL